MNPTDTLPQPGLSTRAVHLADARPDTFTAGDRAEPGLAASTADTARVLRNTYALLAMTLVFSAAVAAASTALALPAPGLLLSLGGMLGLLFLTHRLANSAWGLAAVFAFTGFMGYTLAPALGRTLAMAGGGQIVAMALGATGVAFLALSAWALTTKRDFGFLGGFLFVGCIVALLAAVGAAVFQIPALGLLVAGVVVLLASGLILFETGRIVNGGETNYILATVGLFGAVFNLFSGLLALFGIGGGGDD